MLARDGKVVADDGAKVTFSKSGSETDHHTGKPVPDEMSFEYRDGETRYVLTYTREHTLVSQTLIDIATGRAEAAGRDHQVPGRLSPLLRAGRPSTAARRRGRRALRGARLVRGELLAAHDPRRHGEGSSDDARADSLKE